MRNNRHRHIQQSLSQMSAKMQTKILFAFWMIFGLMTVITLYVCCFVLFPLLLKLILIYSSIFLLFCFLFVIFTASSVNYTANKTHKILNSFLISYSQNARNHYFTQFVLKIKVSFNCPKCKLTQFFIHNF